MRLQFRWWLPVVLSLFGAATVAMDLADLWFLKNQTPQQQLIHFVLFGACVVWLVADRERRIYALTHPRAKLVYDSRETNHQQHGFVQVDDAQCDEYLYA